MEGSLIGAPNVPVGPLHIQLRNTVIPTRKAIPTKKQTLFNGALLFGVYVHLITTPSWNQRFNNLNLLHQLTSNK